MSKYKNFEFIKTIEDFNKIIYNNYYTHFHYICEHNSSNLEIIKYCVEHGADFNFKDVFGYTSFHYICHNKPTKEVLEYCLENGANLTIEDKNGETPFYWICCNNKHLIKYCKPYMNEYDYIKTLKKYNLNWKEYV